MYFYDDIFLFRQIKWLFYVISSDKIKLMFGMLDTKTIIFIENLFHTSVQNNVLNKFTFHNRY